MATAKRVRWECPNDIHPAVLGSTRPLADSVVRYCMPCSMSSGRLEKRVAPALERQREAARVKSAAKAKAAQVRTRAAMKRARDREKAVIDRAMAAEKARYTVEGVDLRDEMGCLLRLKAWKGVFGSPGSDGGFHHSPYLTVTRRSSMPLSRMGFAEPWAWRINIATYPGQTLADAREVLVHELVHLIVGNKPGTEGWHGKEFKATMLAAFKEAYKVGPVGIPDGVWHGRYAAALRKKERPDDA